MGEFIFLCVFISFCVWLVRTSLKQAAAVQPPVIEPEKRSVTRIGPRVICKRFAGESDADYTAFLKRYVEALQERIDRAA